MAAAALSRAQLRPLPRLVPVALQTPPDRVSCPGCAGWFRPGRNGAPHRNHRCPATPVTSQEPAAPPPPPSGAPPSAPSRSISENDWRFVGSLSFPDAFGFPARPQLYVDIPHALRPFVATALAIPLRRIVRSPMQVEGWYLLALFSLWVLPDPGRGGQSGLRETRRRLNLFKYGEWSKLHSEHLQRCTSHTRRHHSPAFPGRQNIEGHPPLHPNQAQPPPTISPSAIRRCLSLARSGQRGRAMAVLTSRPLAPSTQATVSSLQALHPTPSSSPPSWLPDFIPEIPFDLSMESFSLALRRAKARSSPGPSGMRYEHIKDCLEEGAPDGGFELLHSVVSFLAQGRAPPLVLFLLTSSTSLAITKGSNASDIRPIAVGEVLYRLTASAILKQESGVFRDSMVWQLAVGVPGGAEAGVFGVREGLKLKEGSAALQVDVRNAFNMVDRVAFWDFLREGSPRLQSLIPFLRGSYGAPSPLYYFLADEGDEGHSGGVATLWSHRGVRQGDPLGPALFAAAHQKALRPVSEQFESCMFPSFADDTHIVGPLHDVLAAFEAFCLKLVEIGLEVNLGKCRLYVPGGERVAGPEGVRIEEGGLEVLGVPVGDDTWVQAKYQDKVDPFVRGLGELGDLGDPQIAVQLLTHVARQRPSYLSRTLEPTPRWLELLEAFDTTLLAQLDSLIGTSLAYTLTDERARLQAQLPISRGGLGFTPSSAVAPAAFIAGAFAAAPIIHQYFGHHGPELLHHLHTTTSHSLSEASLLLPPCVQELIPPMQTLGDASNARIQDTLTSRLWKSRQDSLLRSSDDPKFQARFRSTGGTGAGGWLEVAPSTLATRVDPSAFSVGVRYRLGLPQPALAGIGQCRCGHGLGLEGQHLWSCAHGGERIALHDRVRDAVAGLGRAAGLKVFVEAQGLVERPNRALDSRGGVVDVVVVKDDGVLHLVDVVVADPCCDSYVERAARRDLAAAKVAIERKRNDYARRPEGSIFTPFALETFGALSSPADDLLKEFAQCASRRPGSAPYNVLLEYFRRRISVALLRGGSRCLLGRARSMYAQRCRSVGADLQGLSLSSAALCAQVTFARGG
jgi:hypothetical protein